MAEDYLGDYFDRVCELPETKVTTKSLKVDKLWKERLDRLVPHKAERLAELYDALFQLMSDYNETGSQPPALFRTPYWDYVKGYQPDWIDRSGYNARRYMNDKMRHAFRLFDSIRADSVRDPLCMITEGDHTYLYRGYHRLVIAKVLGIDKVKVKHAVVG